MAHVASHALAPANPCWTCMVRLHADISGEIEGQLPRLFTPAVRLLAITRCKGTAAPQGWRLTLTECNASSSTAHVLRPHSRRDVTLSSAGAGTRTTSTAIRAHVSIRSTTSAIKTRGCIQSLACHAHSSGQSSTPCVSSEGRACTKMQRSTIQWHRHALPRRATRLGSSASLAWCQCCQCTLWCDPLMFCVSRWQQ